MINPLISVVTICYNAEKDIERTMRSVLNQTYKCLEYIIVDGASTDATMNIVNNIVKEYSGSDIRVISEPDKGIYDAMNKGIRMAKGVWLNMMNAGDVFAENEILDKVFSCIGEDDCHAFIYGNSNIVNGTRLVYTLDTSYEKGLLLHQCCIYKKELHYTYGFYHVTRPIIISDYLFFMSVPSEMFLKIPLVISEYDNGGISQGVWSALQKSCIDYVYHRLSLIQLVRNLITLKVKSVGKYILQKAGFKTR